MFFDGISVKGSYHDINQDNYRVEKLDKGFAIIVSDGLGSRKYSQVGSKAICDCSVEIIHKNEHKLESINIEDLLSEIHQCWLEEISEYSVSDCNATMLILIVYFQRIIAARLGDGFICIYHDDKVDVLFDQKEDSFANETECLTDIFDFNSYEIRDMKVDTLCGGVLCTDGVEIGDMTESILRNFAQDFVEGYSEMDQKDITEDIESWLSDWTGTDDKTLAYFIAER